MIKISLYIVIHFVWLIFKPLWSSDGRRIIYPRWSMTFADLVLLYIVVAPAEWRERRGEEKADFTTVLPSHKKDGYRVSIRVSLRLLGKVNFDVESYWYGMQVWLYSLHFQILDKDGNFWLDHLVETESISILLLPTIRAVLSPTCACRWVGYGAPPPPPPASFSLPSSKHHS